LLVQVGFRFQNLTTLIWCSRAMLHTLPAVGPLAPCQSFRLSCRLLSALGTVGQPGLPIRLARYLAAHPSGAARLAPAVPSVTIPACRSFLPGTRPLNFRRKRRRGHPIPVLPHTVWGLRGAGRLSRPVPGALASPGRRFPSPPTPPNSLRSNKCRRFTAEPRIASSAAAASSQWPRHTAHASTPYGLKI
jgi:hypothetical protein